MSDNTELPICVNDVVVKLDTSGIPQDGKYHYVSQTLLGPFYAPRPRFFRRMWLRLRGRYPWASMTISAYVKKPEIGKGET